MKWVLLSEVPGGSRQTNKNANSQSETEPYFVGRQNRRDGCSKPQGVSPSHDPVPRERHPWPFGFLTATYRSPFLSSEVASSNGHGQSSSESASRQGRA